MVLRDIAEGWFNKLLDSLNLLDEETKKLAKSRLSVCTDCPVRTESKCDSDKFHRKNDGTKFQGCGCNIEAKVLCQHCECPGGRW
jgi:hypothetical protein